ncbi:hypothetical protein ABID47_006027 [Paenibacillus favisporus]|uniref:SH3b domain-containing protein n=1 Tax=Paenibacillus favisporus TaxID=221028 RepID=A0ABV2FC96_9BACL
MMKKIKGNQKVWLNVNLSDSPAMQAVRQMEGITASLVDSPAMQAVRQMEGITASLVDSPAMQAVRQMEGIAVSLVDSPAMQAVRQMEGIAASLVDSPAMQAVRQMGGIGASMIDSPIMRTVARTLETVFKIPKQDEFGIQTYKQELLGVYETALHTIVEKSRVSEDKLSPVDEHSLQNEVEQFSVQVQQDESQNFVEKFIEKYESLNPIVKFLISVILIPYLVNQLSDALTISDLIKRDIQASKSTIIREEKEALSVYTEFETLAVNQLRLVRAEELIARKNPNKNSQIVGLVYIGQRVKLIGKKKDWAYIRYYDHSEDSYKEGWVFARYLVKII